MSSAVLPPGGGVYLLDTSVVILSLRGDNAVRDAHFEWVTGLRVEQW